MAKKPKTPLSVETLSAHGGRYGRAGQAGAIADLFEDFNGLPDTGAKTELP